MLEHYTRTRFHHILGSAKPGTHASSRRCGRPQLELCRCGHARWPIRGGRGRSSSRHHPHAVDVVVHAHPAARLVGRHVAPAAVAAVHLTLVPVVHAVAAHTAVHAAHAAVHHPVAAVAATHSTVHAAAVATVHAAAHSIAAVHAVEAVRGRLNATEL